MIRTTAERAGLPPTAAPIRPAAVRPAAVRPASVGSAARGAAPIGPAAVGPATAGRRHAADPPRRRRRGPGPSGLPVSLLVTVELVLLCVLLAGQRTPALTVAAVAAAASIFVFGLVRTDGIPLATALLRRASYRLRNHETLVNAADSPRAGGVSVAPELAALFPGLVMWEARTRDGDRMAVLHRNRTFAATLRIAPAAGLLRPAGDPAGDPAAVPLDAIMAALEGRDLGLDAVQVLTRTIAGEPLPGPLIHAASTELSGSARRAARVRDCTAFVTVSLDLSSAADAIAMRGGGRPGIARTLSAALSRVASAVEPAGFEARILDADEANRSAADSLCHPATRYEPAVGWVESVRQISSGRMAHRSFVVGGIDRPLPAQLPVGNVFGSFVSVQTRPMAGGWSTRTAVRLACRSEASLDAATHDLQAAARRLGVVLQPLDAAQLQGVRATVPVGGLGDALPAPHASAGRPGYLAVGLSAGGVPLGRTGSRGEVLLDLVRRVPTRVTLVCEDAWLARLLTVRLAGMGIGTVVATDRPGPWQEFGNRVGGQHVALVRTDHCSPLSAPSIGAPLVVIEDADVPPSTYAPRVPWQTTIHVRPGVIVAPGGPLGATPATTTRPDVADRLRLLLDASDCVLVCRLGAAGAGAVSAALGLGTDGAATVAQLGEFETLVVAERRAHLVSVSPTPTELRLR